MATRKQSARRAKTFRHDYGFVISDEEGNEIEAPGAELRAKKDGDAEARREAGRQVGVGLVGPPGHEALRVEPKPPSVEPRAQARRGLGGSAQVLVIRASRCTARSALGLLYAVDVHPAHLLDRRNRLPPVAARSTARRRRHARAKNRRRRAPASLDSNACPVSVDPRGPRAWNTARTATSSAPPTRPTEAAVVDPGGDPAPLLGLLERLGAPLGGHPRHPLRRRPRRRRGGARRRRRQPRSGRRPARSRRSARGQTRGPRGAAARSPAHEVRDGDRVSRRAASSSRSSAFPATRSTTSPSASTASSSPATCSSRARSAGSISRRRLGRAAQLGAAGFSTASAPDAIVYPGHGDPTTLGARARDEPVPGRARAMTVSRSSRRRAGRTTSCRTTIAGGTS